MTASEVPRRARTRIDDKLSVRPAANGGEKSASLVTELASVSDGVFFALGGVLPRGRHALHPDEVQQSQRERILIAATELLAARGIAGCGPTDVVRRAGVSLAAYYNTFSNKEDCLFAGYDRFIDVLLRRLAAIDGDVPPAQFISAAVDTYIDTLQSDLVVARAYQVEIDGLGRAARQRRRDSLRLFANLLADVVAQDPATKQRPVEAHLGQVYAVRQLVADALDEEEQPDLRRIAEVVRPVFADLAASN